MLSYLIKNINSYKVQEILSLDFINILNNILTLNLNNKNDNQILKVIEIINNLVYYANHSQTL